MIEHVSPGQKIKAATVNQIIDSTRVESQSLDVQQTNSGTLINLPNEWRMDSNTRNRIFSVKQGQLSGYPYAAINMGTSLQECLNAVKIHNGTNVMSPVSALVVYRNSAQSPDQNHLTGYVLSSNQFGWDKKIGSTGWLSTKIEWPHSQFQNDLNLEIWSSKNHYAVFTNVSSDQDLKDEISVQLKKGGVADRELSALQRDWKFTLLKCSLLSANDGGTPAYYPTKQIIHNDGEIHVWENGGGGDVVWKADLVCYKVHDNEHSFCYKTWLGPESDYNQSDSLVQAYTKDGDPFLLSAELVDNIETRHDNGVAVKAHKDGGYEIYWDAFHADENGTLNTYPAYITFKFDDDEAVTRGQFAREADASTSLSSDGILSRNVFVANANSFMVTEDMEVGWKAPDSLISRGTYGELQIGAVKTDAYLPRTDSTTSKSIDWMVPHSDTPSPFDNHALQLRGFSSRAATSYLSDDQVVIRRVYTNGSRGIEYVTLGSISGHCDCELSAAQFEVPETIAKWRKTSGDAWTDINIPEITLTATLTSGTKIGTFSKDGQDVDLYAPSAVSGGCSCDLTALLHEGTKIATWTKDGVNMVDVYAPSGGGGGGTTTRLSGNTEDSVWIDGDVCIEAGLSSNVSAWTVIENGIKKLKLGVYYL